MNNSTIKTLQNYYLLLLIIGCIFLSINILTPMHSDDWFYAHITNSSQRIKNICDLFHSQYIHYFEVNGRFIPHLILQFFIGITNKYIFSIANTVIFCLFLHLINIITTNNQRKFFYYTTIINITLICAFFPTFKYVFIWETGACNYLWSATLLLSFHYFLMKEHKKSTNTLIIPLYIIYGIICGWTHEGLVIGLVAGYSYYFIIYKKQIDRVQLYLIIGLIIGAFFLILSPAAINRLELSNDQTSSLLYHLKSYIIAFINFHNLRIFFIFIFSYLIMKKTHFLDNKGMVDCNHIIFFIALIISFLFVWFTKHDGNRSRFGIELYSLICLLIIIPKHTINKHYLHYIIYIILFTLYIILIHFSIINYKEYQYLTDQIQKSKSTETIISYTYENNYPPIIQRFVIRGILPDNLKYYNGFNPNSFECKLLALYFKKEKVYILPKRFIDLLDKQNESIEKFNISTDFPFYFKNQTNTSSNYKFKYILYSPQYVPVYHRPFAHRMQRYSCKELEVDNYTTLQYKNKSYILIGRNSLIDNRVSKIVFE